MFKPKTTISGRLENSSGEWIRTTDLRVMSNAPESVLFVRRVLQISQTEELWFLLAWHAAVVDRYSYSTFFTLVSQVLFLTKYPFEKLNNELCLSYKFRARNLFTTHKDLKFIIGK